MKMSTFQKKSIHHFKNQDALRPTEKKTINRCRHLEQRTSHIKLFQWTIRKTCLKKGKNKNRNSQQRNLRYKEEPDWNFRTEKYNNQNKELGGQAQQQNREEKQAVNGKVEQQKLPNLDNGEQIDWKRT